MEAQVYPIAIDLDREDTIYNQPFFQETPSRVRDWVEMSDSLSSVLKLVSVEDFRPGHYIEVILNDEESYTLAFLTPYA